MQTHGITKFRYVLLRHDKLVGSAGGGSKVPYVIFACQSMEHLLAWQLDEEMEIVEVSRDASDKERWRLERLGEVLSELVPVMEL